MKEGETLDIWSEVWDVEGAANALSASAEPYNDVVIGCGYRLRLEKAPAEIQLFPDQHVACIRRPYFDIRMSDVTEVEPLEGRVRIEASDFKTKAVAVFESTGSITFHCSDREKPQVAPPKEGPQAESISTQTEKKEAENRVTLTGRIGRDPELRTTSNGKKVLRVPLAVHKEGQDKAEWHNVLFFEEKAVKAHETLKKGELITIYGYVHTREALTKTGIKKQVEEIYAAGFGTPKEKK